MPKDWSVYVVECVDSSLYTGVSTDVGRRITEHNTSKRGSKYTRSRRPVKLVFSKHHMHRGCALKVEYKFKKMKTIEKRMVVYENVSINDYVHLECECYNR